MISKDKTHIGAFKKFGQKESGLKDRSALHLKSSVGDHGCQPACEYELRYCIGSPYRHSILKCLCKCFCLEDLNKISIPGLSYGWQELGFGNTHSPHMTEGKVNSICKRVKVKKQECGSKGDHEDISPFVIMPFQV